MRIKKEILYFIAPDFLERESIFGSISCLLKKYKNEFKNKKLLDIGCGSKPYEFLFRKLDIIYEGIDFRDYSCNYSYELNKPDYFFNGNYKKDYKLLRFKSNSYEIIAAFQVLEHHENLDMFFSEASRILKKGGYLLISFPFIWELHEEPNDFQRLTHYRIEKLCQNNHLKVTEIIKRGSYLSVISQLIDLSLLNSGLPSLIKDLAYFTLLLPLRFLSYFYDKIPANPRRKIFLGYTLLIKKG